MSVAQFLPNNAQTMFNNFVLSTYITDFFENWWFRWDYYKAKAGSYFMSVCEVIRVCKIFVLL